MRAPTQMEHELTRLIKKHSEDSMQAIFNEIAKCVDDKTLSEQEGARYLRTATCALAGTIVAAFHLAHYAHEPSEEQHKLAVKELVELTADMTLNHVLKNLQTPPKESMH